MASAAEVSPSQVTRGPTQFRNTKRAKTNARFCFLGVNVGASQPRPFFNNMRYLRRRATWPLAIKVHWTFTISLGPVLTLGRLGQASETSSAPRR